jgi:hypothetical protein
VNPVIEAGRPNLSPYIIVNEAQNVQKRSAFATPSQADAWRDLGLSVKASLQADDTASARRQLEQDLLPRTDGCAANRARCG